MKCGSQHLVAAFCDVFEAIHSLGSDLWKAASGGAALPIKTGEVLQVQFFMADSVLVKMRDKFRRFLPATSRRRWRFSGVWASICFGAPLSDTGPGRAHHRQTNQPTNQSSKPTKPTKPTRPTQPTKDDNDNNSNHNNKNKNPIWGGSVFVHRTHHRTHIFLSLVSLRGVLSRSSLCCAHIYLSNAHTRWLKLGLKLKV